MCLKSDQVYEYRSLSPVTFDSEVFFVPLCLFKNIVAKFMGLNSKP